METKIIIYNIIISLVTIFIPTAFSLTNNPVLDINGNQLQSNTKYYIIPLHGGGGGGLGLSRRSPLDPCPPNVMQLNDVASSGLSLKLFPLGSRQLQSINVSADLNFVVVGATTCVQMTVWKLFGPDPITGRRYVRSDGVLGRAGAATVGNWFKIEKSGEGYKIVYCPSVCSTCRVACGDVGVFVEKYGRRWLGVGGQPLVIAFKKSKI